MSAEATPALLDLAAAVDTALADDGLVLEPIRLVVDVELLTASMTKVQAKTVRALRAAYDADATTKICGKPVRSWLIEDLGLSRSVVNKLMHLVRFLHYFPATQAALDAAAITLEHASTIVHALLALPDRIRATVEEVLLRESRSASASEVDQLVDQLLEAMGYDKESDKRRERMLTRRGFGISERVDSLHVASGNLTPEAAETVKLALEAAAQTAGDDDERSLRQRWHDGLETIAQFFLSHADVPTINGEQPRLVVTIRWDDLLAAAGVSRLARLGSGATIPVETARRLCCDGGVLPMVLGGRGEVLDVGRAGRSFTSATKRAALLQQGGHCAFSGCRRPPTRAHHIVFWSHGGGSDLHNCAWLCEYHHWLVHDGGWTMRRDDDGFTFISPYGAERHRRLQAA